MPMSTVMPLFRFAAPELIRRATRGVCSVSLLWTAPDRPNSVSSAIRGAARRGRPAGLRGPRVRLPDPPPRRAAHASVAPAGAARTGSRRSGRVRRRVRHLRAPGEPRGPRRPPAGTSHAGPCHRPDGTSPDIPRAPARTVSPAGRRTVPGVRRWGSDRRRSANAVGPSSWHCRAGLAEEGLRSTARTRERLVRILRRSPAPAPPHRIGCTVCCSSPECSEPQRVWSPGPVALARAPFSPPPSPPEAPATGTAQVKFP